MTRFRRNFFPLSRFCAVSVRCCEKESSPLPGGFSVRAVASLLLRELLEVAVVAATVHTYLPYIASLPYHTNHHTILLPSYFRKIQDPYIREESPSPSTNGMSSCDDPHCQRRPHATSTTRLCLHPPGGLLEFSTGPPQKSNSSFDTNNDSLNDIIEINNSAARLISSSLPISSSCRQQQFQNLEAALSSLKKALTSLHHIVVQSSHTVSPLSTDSSSHPRGISARMIVPFNASSPTTSFHSSSPVVLIHDAATTTSMVTSTTTAQNAASLVSAVIVYNIALIYGQVGAIRNNQERAVSLYRRALSLLGSLEQSTSSTVLLLQAACLNNLGCLLYTYRTSGMFRTTSTFDSLCPTQRDQRRRDQDVLEWCLPQCILSLSASRSGKSGIESNRI